MSVYAYENQYLCYDCYVAACDEAEMRGHCEYYNNDGDENYYPIQIATMPKDAPAHCQGNYCCNKLEWENSNDKD